MREEVVVYVNGVPLVLREDERPFKNMQVSLLYNELAHPQRSWLLTLSCVESLVCASNPWLSFLTAAYRFDVCV